MTYEYKATSSMLPQGATSPIMSESQMTDWLNNMNADGWEFVGYAQKWWHGQNIPQDWWVFKRIVKSNNWVGPK